jgi:HEAT repeat protein
LAGRLQDADGGVRYWAAMGFLQRDARATIDGDGVVAGLEQCLSDASLSVRIPAAEALVRFGPEASRPAALETLADCADGSRHGLFVAIAALNAIDELGALAASVWPTLKDLPPFQPGPRLGDYAPRLLQKILKEGRN